MKRFIALAALLVVACGVATVHAQTLKLAYRQGDTHSFATHLVVNESIDVGGVAEPLGVDITATETEAIRSVDGSGLADATLTFSDVSGKVSAGGQTTTVSRTLAPIEMRIAPDGRALSMNGVSFTGGSPFSSLGSSGPESAVLPDNAVKPGDAWTKAYDRANPLGSGTVSVTAHSKYLRDEKVNGVQTAVIETKSTVPLTITIDLSKYSQAIGSSAMTTLTNFGITGMAVKGTDNVDTTTWIDAKGHAIQKSSDKVGIDATFSFVPAPGATYPGPTGPFTIKGDEAIDLVAK